MQSAIRRSSRIINQRGLSMLNDKVILITGGTGSFGKKFVEIVFSRFKPQKVIVYSRDEYKQYLMKKELEAKLSKDQVSRLRYFIGDVRDKERLYRSFKDVDYVVHAAAMKQVPACEYNPFEAIKTNINGAQNVIDAALDRGVKKVVALSTDKAVNPINLYGGTKLVSDKLFVSANSYSGEHGTVFSVVRYGNVAGSRGSVIPFFKELTESGCNVIPITDFRMTRFWITLEEGVDLVFKALEESKGGETYISKIPSFKIIDLAKAINPNCVLKEVGIREGEKLHEVMLPKDESKFSFEYEKHYIVYPNYEWWQNSKHFTSGGHTISDGFEYNSETNNQWLSISDLIEKLRSFE